MNRFLLSALLSVVSFGALAIDHPGITGPDIQGMPLIAGSVPTDIVVDPSDASGICMAARNLSRDFGLVCGTEAKVVSYTSGMPDAPRQCVIAGSIDSPMMSMLVRHGKIDVSQLKGKREKYVMATVDSPLPGMERALVIAGSDRRGAIYGIYELSEQIGVSPWHDWADVPVRHNSDLSITPGQYTAGEPAVRYRGIFLNDEAPCLTGWVRNTYGTEYGDHRFYARVCELILRLRGNFLWPAMWSWAFYADDPLNSRTADEMGVIIGTSHHEPMARNHQEWARQRDSYGAWNYASNRPVLDRFFREGVERMKDTEDVVTIGMRGDGDEAMSADADVKLLEQIIANQRRIIKNVTGRPAAETPQVWALYKEVLDYYDAGLKVPDDVTLLLCDDNWGNVRRLPDSGERRHPGGWGMYYHVDYVGAPRNSKLLNCTPEQNLWEQMRLAYDYGVDRLWILNVGDLKPMEYPITLFLDMAWNPLRFTSENLSEHTRRFFADIVGEEESAEAARIFSLLCKYNGRVTPEMLDMNTYSLADGEWRKVTDRYMRLEAEAWRQYARLDNDRRDAYQQTILFPVRLMCNLYDMYYSQAMNHCLYDRGMPEANEWADRVQECFERDAQLMRFYNKEMSGGKWDGMMTQKHIGYTSWHDNFPADTCPVTKRIDVTSGPAGGYVYEPSEGCVVMEAPHFYKSVATADTEWTVYHGMGRTLGGVALTPYTRDAAGACLEYRAKLPADVKKVTAHVVVKSTLAFANRGGHRYMVGFDGAQAGTINFNADLNEKPENIYDTYYPTIARRAVEKTIELDVPRHDESETVTFRFSPLDPGIVLEKVVLDWGGYSPGYLFGEESPVSRPG